LTLLILELVLLISGQDCVFRWCFTMTDSKSPEAKSPTHGYCLLNI